MIMFCSASVVLLSCRIITATRKEGKHLGVLYFFLGLIAGLGWWTTQLIAAALLTSMLLLIIGLGSRVFTWRLFLGLGAFFLGGLPFWVYNVTHGWPTFAFADSLGNISFFHGVRLFISNRFIKLVDLDFAGAIVPVMGVIIYVLSGMIAVWLLVRFIRTKQSHHWAPLLGALLFILVSILVYSTSRYASVGVVRYLLPLVPALAIVLGMATRTLCSRLPYGLGWIPMLFLICLQLRILPSAWSYEEKQSRKQQSIEEAGQFLEEQSIGSLYASNILRYWNFALRERIIVADVLKDVYPPNARFVELSEHPGILQDCGRFSRFIAATSATTKMKKIGGFGLHYDYLPPQDGKTEISPDMWSSVTDSTGQDIRELLADRSLDTAWASFRYPHADWIEISFHEPVTISGLRLVAKNKEHYPGLLQVEGMGPKSLAWRALHHATPFTGYYWSGDRPFWMGTYHRMEVFFPAHTVSRLRISNKTDEDLMHRNWSIQELQLFSPGQAFTSERESLPLLLSELQKRNIRHLYADRWPANEVHNASQGSIWTPRERTIFPDDRHPKAEHIQKQYLLPLNGDRIMLFTRDTAMLTRFENAPLVRRSLAQRRIVMRETCLGPWVLFDFAPGQWAGDNTAPVGLWWAGFASFPTTILANAREILPEAVRRESVGKKAFFYEDNNWTTGDTRITNLKYLTTSRDVYLVLSLKGPHPQGQDRDSLGLELWVNNTRLPFVRQDGFDFFFWMKSGFKEINSIRITSKTFVPQKLGINEDTRVLGIMVHSLSLKEKLPAS